jgi:hypothetical protein
VPLPVFEQAGDGWIGELSAVLRHCKLHSGFAADRECVRCQAGRLGASAARGRGRRRRGGRAASRVLGEPADDEGSEEQKPRVDRAWLVERDFDRPPTPAFAVEECELAVAIGDRFAGILLERRDSNPRPPA